MDYSYAFKQLKKQVKIKEMFKEYIKMTNDYEVVRRKYQDVIKQMREKVVADFSIMEEYLNTLAVLDERIDKMVKAIRDVEN